MKGPLNPPLNVGDIVVCYHMDGETSVVPGTKGKVKSISRDPFEPEGELIYNVDWENGSTLGLLSSQDAWKKLEQIEEQVDKNWKFITENPDIYEHFDWKWFREFLTKIRDSGIINMFGASPLLYSGRDHIDRYYGEGRVLDPFAGGSVRGIVATEMGFIYNGIDLSDEQIEANKKQSQKPNWIQGDSEWVIDSIQDKTQDFVFTCPPYYDLEKYTDDPADLSNMDEDSFDKKYYSILRKAAEKLKDNRFFAVVVSEVREQSLTGNYKIGKYKGLVWKTIQACEEAGLHFYNDMVLFNSQHQASRVVDTYFERNRKVASVHQNILVFVKGNPDIATESIVNGDTFICIVEGKQYRSFREAAIDINPNELVATEVERRCRSTKSKYKDWQIIGEETNPTIKYEIDGVPFENPNLADID